MIPRILHSAFFGDWPYTPLNLRCHASWEKHLSGFQRMHWTPRNLPKECLAHPWMKEATKALREGNRLSGTDLNFMAFLCYWALHKYGGIWLDNDVELLQTPDLSPGFFLGWQTDVHPYTSASCSTIGGVAGHPFSARLLKRLAEQEPTCTPTATGPELITSQLVEQGLRLNGKEQVIGGVKIYEKDVLYPWAWFEEPDRAKVTSRTVAIHWWEGSWSPGNRHPAARDSFDL